MSVNHPSATVSYDNVKFDFPQSGEWVRMEIAPGERRRVSLGNSPGFRTEGVINIGCMVAEETGTATVFDIVDTVVREMVDVQYSTTDGRVLTHKVRVSNRGVVEGWFMVQCKIEFMYDEQPS